MHGVARSRALGCLVATLAMFGVAACGGAGTAKSRVQAAAVSAGKPTSFGCFASLGVYDVYLTVYGLASTVTEARDNFGALLAEVVPHITAIP